MSLHQVFQFSIRYRIKFNYQFNVLSIIYEYYINIQTIKQTKDNLSEKVYVLYTA